MNLLCEDEAAEAILNGVLDHLAVQHDIRRESVRVGRNTGASEFPSHAAAFRKFGLLENFVFVLDGDQRDGSIEQKMHEQAKGETVPVLYLPGKQGPEAWVWEQLIRNSSEIAEKIAATPDTLKEEMERIDAVYAAAGDSPAEVAKTKIHELARLHDRKSVEICRTVSLLEVQDPNSEIQPVAEKLIDILMRWRNEG